MINSTSVVNICQLNCSGLSQQTAIAADKFMHDQHIDIIALQETGNLNTEALPSMVGKTFFHHYATHGVGVAVNNSMLPVAVTDLNLHCTDIEATWVLCRVDGKSTMIGSLYSPPSVKTLKPILKFIEKVWRYCQTNSIQGLLCLGDFNARSITWGDHVLNYKGRELGNFVDSHSEFVVHSPGSRTFQSINPAGFSVIDLAISAGFLSDQLNLSRVDEEVELFTGAPSRGHFPVIHSIDGRRLKRTEFLRRDFINCDWDVWKQTLDARLLESFDNWNHLSAMQLWELLLCHITEVNDQLIPMKKVSTHSKPYWSKELSAKSLAVRAARGAYQARSTPVNKDSYDHIKKEFAQLLVTEKNAWIHKRLEGLNVSESAEFWSKYKFVFGSKRDNFIGDLQQDGKLISSNEDKEKLLHQTFFSGQHLENVEFDSEHYDKIVFELPEKLLEPATHDAEERLNQEIDAGDVLLAISKQKSGSKATDTYGIHPIMLKHLGYNAITILCILFNKMFDDPSWVWTESMTSFIKKDGKPDYTQPGAYRPICISSYVGKIFERILERRLVRFALTEDIIDDAQEGFLPHRNTTRYLYKMISSIHEVRRKKMTAMILLIDFEKAYDSVPINCLLYKLHKFGIRGKILKLVTCFLTTRTTKLKVNEFIGMAHILTMIGLPQGAVLSPILFILYVSDLLDHRCLPEALRERAQGFKFADDGSVAAIGVNMLECWAIMKGICAHISTWCSKWRLIINCNPNKTEVLALFSSDDIVNFLPPLEISGKTIKYVHKSKVLGVVLDDRLSFIPHARSKLQACWFAWNNLCRHTTKIAGLNSSSLSMLFKCVVLTKLLYAAPVWLDENMSVFKDFMSRVRLKISGAEFHLPKSAAHMLINIPPLDILSISCATRFILKCLSSRDQMSSLVYQIEYTPGHKFYKHSILVKQFLKWRTETDIAPRNIDLQSVDRKHLLYNKIVISKYIGKIWDRQLHLECGLSNRQVKTDMAQTLLKPFLQRWESRDDQVQYKDFIHGRSARFQNFRKSVKLTTADTCLDCNTAVDSNIHKLFYCDAFSGIERDRFVQSITGNTDAFEECVLFSDEAEHKVSYKSLVQYICSAGVPYDYRVILNR